MRVLLTVQPGEGHLQPLLPLARALVAAGHAVAVACATGFRAEVAAHGLPAFPVGLDFRLDPGVAARWPALATLAPDERNAYFWGTIFAGDAAERALPDLLALARAWAPDVIVRDLCEFGGYLAAEALGLPHASVEVGLFAMYRRQAAVVRHALTRLRRVAGLPPDDDGADGRLFAHLHLSFVPPSFQDPAAPPPPTARVLRPTLGVVPPGARPPAWLATLPARPTIYATLGTTHNPRSGLFEAILAGVGALDVNLIATVGRGRDPATLGPQPPHVRVERYLPQALVLPRCDLVVAHGGFSTVLGALAAGRPLVLLPGGADQPLHAARAAALDTAVVLGPDEREPRAIGAAVQSALADPAYRRNAERIRDETAALPGPEHAVALLERLARDRVPIPAG